MSATTNPEHVMKPTIGRILHYTMSAAFGAHPHAVGQVRPCIVVAVWPDEYGPGVDGYNVQVFTDGRNDFDDGRATLWMTSVRLVEQPTEGAIHWPPRA